MKRIKYISYSLILFLLWNINSPGQSLSFKKYSSDEGLPQNTINDLLQDRQGYVWIATEDGAAKFDGINFQKYVVRDTAQNPTVRSLFQCSNGTIWFGTNTGVWRLINNKVQILDSPLLYKTVVTSIYQIDTNKVWIGTTKKGLLEYSKDSVYYAFDTSFFHSGDISDIKADGNGNIWIGTIGDGVYKYNGNTLKRFGKSEGNISDSVYAIHPDYLGRIWFGTNVGITYLQNEKFRYIRSKKNIRSFVRAITEDKDQNIWFTYYGDGIAYWDGKSFHRYTRENGLNSNFVRAILSDMRGDLWFGTRNGLAILSAEKFEIYSEANGLASNLVYSIGEDAEGNFYFGHDGYGLTELDKNGNYKYLTIDDGLAANGVSSIHLDKNKNLWFGTLNGVSKYNGKEFTNFTVDNGLAGNIVLCIEEDREGNLWFGGQGGATKFNGDSLEIYNTDSGLPPDWVQDIYQDDDGSIWFATDEGGVAKYNNKSFTIYNADDGLKRNSILCITKDPFGNYWFGTDGGGISKFDGSKFQNYNVEDGLSSDVCYSIVEEDNFLYVATTKGITKIDYTNIEEKGKEAFQIYSKEIGLLNSEMTQGGVFKDSKGNIWFGSHGGVIKINPIYRPNLVPPPIYINNVRVLQVGGRLDTTAIDGLELEYYQNNFRFDYIALSFNSPEKLIYKTKLIGLADTNWTETKETAITYPYLPPGEYNFIVKAKNNDGVWSVPTSMSFIIYPPFYSTVWFSALMFIIGATAIYGFYLFKTAQVKRRNIELANTVRARTKELSEEKNKSDELLLNILPVSLVHELKTIGHVEPREFKSISILFTDFKGFTYTSSVLPADKLVNELNDIFKGFDEIIVKYGCEKLKTIGDAYMAGAGLPVETKDHAIRIVMAAREMQKFIIARNEQSAIKWEMRAGVHTGNVIAGVVGTKKFTYDIWGDTVNIASRMESSGEPGEINVSAYTYMLIRDYFRCEYRGKLDAKGKGKVDMYFVKELLSEKESELRAMVLG